ncbi:MAG: DUF1349 domain-containing protein [Opitutaceae bacterium]
MESPPPCEPYERISPAARLLDLDAVVRPMGSTGYVDPGFLDGWPHDFHARLENDLLQHEPDIVLVSGGVNDQSHPLDNQNDPAAFKQAVESLFDRVNARLPNATKVALSPFWPNQRFPAVNSQYTDTAGSDIWGGSDQFHFARQAITGDTELVVRVTSFAQTDAWAKAGLMLRVSSAPGAAHVSVFATPGNGVRMQWRSGEWSQSATSGGNGQSVPRWLKLIRSGNTFTAFSSANGSSWEQVHALTLALPQNLLGGLAVTSHNSSSRTTATFTNFSISGASPSNGDSGGSGGSNDQSDPSDQPDNSETTPPAQGGGGGGAGDASGLVQLDIGGPTIAGSTSFDAATDAYYMKAAGNDIWTNTDQFQYAYKQLDGDSTLIARVTSLSPTDIWARAGLMIRSDLTGPSAHVSVFVTPGMGVVMQARNSLWSQSSTTGSHAGIAPQWLKLVRRGSVFTTYRSSNGTTWDQVASYTINLPKTVYVGLAATSRNPGATTDVVFSNVSITQQ